ncbi:hypothetical protein GCM10022225_80030 [Plantactinospora mayteni]|uniref:Uncharacterized protein n=1 Tax=Plantactinospora mayteni TaxID=566021 RepID=A0ABQ4F3A8_9ACTN|nr:hypothetical protein Pma05_79240 [Plantactinospora mayteni]
MLANYGSNLETTLEFQEEITVFAPKSVAKQVGIALSHSGLALVTMFAAVAGVSLTAVPASASSAPAASNAAAFWCPVYITDDGNGAWAACSGAVAGNTRYRVIVFCTDLRTYTGPWVRAPWPSVAGCGSARATGGNFEHECQGVCFSNPDAAIAARYPEVK